MSGTVLLFGFDSLLTILALEAAVGPLGGEVIPVARGDYNKPLAVLAGMDAEETPGLPYAGGPLGGRMVVLCGLDGKLEELLPALARAGAGPDCLKAVLTPHNRSWTPIRLHAELLRERQAMQGR